MTNSSSRKSTGPTPAAEPARQPPLPTTPLERALLVGAMLLELAWLGVLVVLVVKK